MEPASNVVPLQPGRYSLTGQTGTPNPVWDACEVALGYSPKTKTEQSLWAMKVNSLKGADATPEQIQSVAEWYRRHWPGIDLTIGALEKWYSHFLAMAEKKEKSKARRQASTCPVCEMGGGLHTADCKTLH